MFYSAKSWVILSDVEKRIREKIEENGVPICDWDIRINYGIKTGFNEAFIIDGEKREFILSKCSTLEERKKTAELIRPILRGRDIRRFGYTFSNLWLINSHNGLKEKGVNPINIGDYPAIKDHLDKYFSYLEKRVDKGDTPYNLRNCAYMEDFSLQKIVWGNLNLRASYSLVPGNIFINAPCPFIVPASNYLLAILNSKLGDYYIRSLGVTRNGGYFEYKPMYVEKLPVPVISSEKQAQFEELVNHLLLQTSLGNDTTAVEREIDDLIISLYHLSPEEARLILK